VKFSALGIAIALLSGPEVVSAADLNETYEQLQQAVAKKDAALVKKLAVEIQPLIKQDLDEPAPQGEEEKQTWGTRQDWVKGIAIYADYALYATAVASPPAATVDLIATLEQSSPKSKYMDEAYGPYLNALSKTGAGGKIPAVAEKGLANFPENEDLLMVLADNAVSRRQNDRALTYANRLVAVLNRHPKPDGTGAADWDRKRNAMLGRGYWISGIVSGESNQYAAADRNLRAALPLIQGTGSMTGPALFYLGVANYNIGKMTNNKARMLEGAKFSDQSAAIAGPLQDQAWRNAALIKKEAAAMR
jgi:hypothetical protein